MADSEAKRAWDAAHTTFIGLKLNNNTDADILRHLDKQASKQGYIKALIRKDIAAVPEVEPDEWDMRMLKAADRDALYADNDVMLYDEYVKLRDHDRM